MKRTLAIATLFVGPVLWAAAAIAEEAKPPAKPATTSATQPLVDASRGAKAKRKKSSTKVITNADVKKSKGKLIVISPSKLDEPLAEEKKTPTLAEQEGQRRLRFTASERVATAEKNASELEAEINRLEQRFYEENDPEYRDNVIQKKFTEAKRQLDDAQRELGNARAELQKYENPPTP
ncbi:MAG: hypothetical protein JJE51_03635 [Thermoanaerobaculia bacterium]|nr:hypothetical protein [Thermoanaerobaculia bacterium]